MNWNNIDIGAFLDDPTAEPIRPGGEKLNDGMTYLFPLVNQGTKVKEVFRGFTTSTGTLAAQAAASINAGAAFTIPANELGLVTFIQFASGDGTVDTPGSTDYGYTKFSFIIETGAKTYGSGGTALTGGNLIELAPVRVDIDSDYIFSLGNIGASTIQDFVNGSGPYVVDGLAVFEATQSGVDKVWLFTGGNGTFGTGATATTANMFVDLSAQDPIPATPVAYLPLKVINTTPYTLTYDDLNRPLHFTSNNQVVNIENTLVELAANQGLTLYDFVAYFSGTGTHTVNKAGSPIYTGGQGSLVKGLCYDTAGVSLWVVKPWFDAGMVATPTLQEVVEQGTTSDRDIFIIGRRLGKGAGTPSFNSNTVFGENALDSNTTGNSNVAIGKDTLRNLASGFTNIAIGSSALKNLTGSFKSSNIAIGANAGASYNPSGGNPNLTDANQSIFIGEAAVPLGDGQLNQIVIGHQAIGNGSNTATIGNDSILKTFLKGALKLVARTRASVTGLAAGLFIFDSGDSNRPTAYNGTDWKGLAYKDEVPEVSATNYNTQFDNEIAF